MPDYSKNDPKGWMGDAKRGAALGRVDSAATDSGAGKWTLQRVRINGGGYDRLGSYWGIGAPLYRATDDGVDVTFRAADRAAAKAHIRAEYPGARFYR